MGKSFSKLNVKAQYCCLVKNFEQQFDDYTNYFFNMAEAQRLQQNSQQIRKGQKHCCEDTGKAAMKTLNEFLASTCSTFGEFSRWNSGGQKSLKLCYIEILIDAVLIEIEKNKG